MIPHTTIPLLLAATVTATCPRSALQAATAALVTAQTTGNLSALPPLTPNATYHENDVPLPLPSSILSNALPIDLTRSLHDITHCATSTEFISASASHPYVLMTRMQLQFDASPTTAGAGAGAGGTLRIATIENVVADAGDWLFNAQQSLRYASAEVWDEIPEAERDARGTVQAAGDRYLDSWADGNVSVPYGEPCARLEGGSYTRTCKMPVFPEGFIEAGGAKNRRSVVDEVVGAVDIFNDFPWLDKERYNGTSSTNLVRVEKGKIRYIHEVTICTKFNCGMASIGV